MKTLNLRNYKTKLQFLDERGNLTVRELDYDFKNSLLGLLFIFPLDIETLKKHEALAKHIEASGDEVSLAEDYVQLLKNLVKEYKFFRKDIEFVNRILSL